MTFHELLTLHVIYAGGGNEFGITNVSSDGKVSITVVPPRQLRGKSLPRNHVTRLASPSPSQHSSARNEESYKTSYTVNTSKSSSSSSNHVVDGMHMQSPDIYNVKGIEKWENLCLF